MSDDELELPEPLRTAGATDLERRLLDAASRERPSRGATERMARSLGVAPPALGGAEIGPSAGESLLAPGRVAPSGMSWFSSAIIAVAVGGAAIGGALFALRSETARAPVPGSQPQVTAGELATAPTTTAEQGPGVSGGQAPAPPAGAVPRPRPSASGGDLGEQIALLDAARGAMAAGSDGRALELLDRYLAKYPSGSFRPEATALKIETLVTLGRKADARGLAERFIAAQPGSPLAKRVQRLTDPAAR